MTQVYFARSDTTGLIKIGFSKDPDTRMRDLTIGAGGKVKVLLLLDGGAFLERKMHSRFSKHREYGEWFRNEGKLQDFLANKSVIPANDDQKPVVNSVPSIQLLTGLIRGFCTSDIGNVALQTYGIPDALVWQRGRGAEEIQACIDHYRGAAGWLVLPTDLRELGSNKKAISEIAVDLEKRKIRVLDLSHPEDDTYSAAVQRAHQMISAKRFADPRTARNQGRWGGQAKGVKAKARRDALMAEDIVRRLVAHPKLTLRDCSAILGPQFSVATLYRNYRNQDES